MNSKKNTIEQATRARPTQEEENDLQTRDRKENLD